MTSTLLPVRALILALSLGSLAACDSATETSLYDPNAPRNQAPVVESVSPSGVVLAGIDVITVTGRNFSATMSDNLVVFDDGRGASASGVITEATTTMLKVKVPNLPNAALRLRVSVLGAPDYSAPFALPLASATTPFGGLDSGTAEGVFGIASNVAGDLIAQVSAGTTPAGIFRFAGDAPRTRVFASTETWADLTVAPNGTLYGVRRLRAAFRLPLNGTQQTFSVQPNGVTLAAIAAAPNGDVWTGGSNAVPASGALYRVTSAGVSTPYPFAETVRDLVVAGGALYVASVTAESAKVWRYALSADGTLGAGAVYVDVAAALGPAVTLNAIAVARDGTLFVGTNAANPVLEVPAGGGTPVPLFPGVLRPPVSALAWAAGSKLYVSQQAVGATVTTAVVPARLYLLETRRQGPN